MKDSLCIRKFINVVFTGSPKMNKSHEVSSSPFNHGLPYDHTNKNRGKGHVMCLKMMEKGRSVTVKNEMCSNNTNEIRKCFPIWPLLMHLVVHIAPCSNIFLWLKKNTYSLQKIQNIQRDKKITCKLFFIVSASSNHC